MTLKDVLITLAFNSWSSPEAVTTSIVTIITAITGLVTAIISASRNQDRKNGRSHCKITGQKLKQKEPKK